MSPKQFEAICQLSAYWFDQSRVPWNTFPVNPHIGSGIVTHFLHREFATKGCPWAAVADQIDRMQTRIRAILKAAQTDDSTTPETVPPPAPVLPTHACWPQGYDISQLRSRFGGLLRHDPSGSTRILGFDPDGAISNAWLARGVADRLPVASLPAARDWWIHPRASGTTLDIITFDRGWVLIRNESGRSWRWLA